MRIFKRKETATAVPELEQAMQQNAEKRKKRGTSKRVLHTVRPENITRNR